MTSLNGNIFRVTGLLCGEITGHRWIPRTKASDTKLWCFLWFAHWINGWVNSGETDDLGRHRAHYDVIVMPLRLMISGHGVKQDLDYTGFSTRMVNILIPEGSDITWQYNPFSRRIYASPSFSYSNILQGTRRAMVWVMLWKALYICIKKTQNNFFLSWNVNPTG